MNACIARSLLQSLLALFLVAAAVQASDDTSALKHKRDDLSEADLRRVEAITVPVTDFSKAERYEAMSAGAGTSIAPNDQDSFTQFSANLAFEDEEGFKLGDALFEKLWVSSPSSTQAARSTSGGMGTG